MLREATAHVNCCAYSPAAVDATIKALEAAIDQLRRIGLQTLDIQPGSENAIPEQLYVVHITATIISTAALPPPRTEKPL